MKHKLFYIKHFFLLVFCTINLLAQQKVEPGAVSNPYFWLKPKNIGDSFYWENLSKNNTTISHKKQKGVAFNFNPSIVFDTTQDSIILPLGVDNKRRQTLFLIYKVNDSLKEQYLWTINNPQKTLSVATNKRLVDLKKYSYQSYQEKIELHKANIHFFQQNVTDSVAKPATLIIGQKSKFEQLPPEEFNGNISEVLVYNRILSTIETQKVASYLGIKYGISLSQFEIKNYLNSLGKTIWDSNKHKGFDSSITGIGRDDASGLLQPKSSNMFDEGLLTMELKSKTNEIPNNYFVFWSDNGKNLLAKKQEQGEPMGIARQWQLDFTSTADLTLDWIFNPSYIKGTLPKDYYYWLLVDYSGKGTYNENDSEYIRLGSTSSKEKLILTDFNWDKQKTAKTKFTIKIAPKMFSRAWIDQATCGLTNSGKLHYSIEGGEAPFTITVKKEGSNEILKQWNQSAKSNTELQLSSGNYEYIVKDAKGNLYTETLFVADKEGTFPNLKPDYKLINGNPLVLDASAGLPEENYEYQWYYEGDFIDNNPKITITQAGNYELRLFSEQNCKTTSKIEVSTDGKEIVDSSNVILYPNPTTNGYFTVSMQFPKKTNATITINSLTGALLKQKKITQIQTYIYADYLTTSGIYLVTVNSDFGTKTFKVIKK